MNRRTNAFFVALTMAGPVAVSAQMRGSAGVSEPMSGPAFIGGNAGLQPLLQVMTMAPSASGLTTPGNLQALGPLAAVLPADFAERAKTAKTSGNSEDLAALGRMIASAYAASVGPALAEIDARSLAAAQAAAADPAKLAELNTTAIDLKAYSIYGEAARAKAAVFAEQAWAARTQDLAGKMAERLLNESRSRLNGAEGAVSGADSSRKKIPDSGKLQRYPKQIVRLNGVEYPSHVFSANAEELMVQAIDKADREITLLDWISSYPPAVREALHRAGLRNVAVRQLPAQYAGKERDSIRHVKTLILDDTVIADETYDPLIGHSNAEKNNFEEIEFHAGPDLVAAYKRYFDMLQHSKRAVFDAAALPVDAAPAQKKSVDAVPSPSSDGLLQRIKADTARAERATTLAVLKKDYGDGLSGSMMLALIAQLSKVAGESARRKDAAARSEYEARPWIVRWAYPKPLDEPSGVSFFNYYVNFGRRGLFGGFEDTPRMKAADAALVALEKEGLVRPDGIGNHQYHFSSHMYGTLSITPRGAELVDQDLIAREDLTVGLRARTRETEEQNAASIVNANYGAGITGRLMLNLLLTLGGQQEVSYFKVYSQFGGQKDFPDGFEGTPRMKGADAALQALEKEGLVRSSGNHQYHFDHRMNGTVRITPSGIQLANKPE